MNCKQRNRDVVVFFYYLLFVFYHAAENAMLGSWKKNNRCCCASSWVLPGYCRALRIANWINWTSNFSLLSSLVWMLENLFFVHVLCVLQYVGEWGDGFWSQSSVVNCVSCPRIVIVWNIKIQVSLFPAIAISFWCFDCRKRNILCLEVSPEKLIFFLINVGIRVNLRAPRLITRVLKFTTM